MKTNTFVMTAMLMLSGSATSAQEAASNPDALEEVVVLSQREALDRSVEGAKIPVPLIKLPQSVTVIDRELLDDQNVVELQDALRNSGGVVPGGYFDGFDFYRIRGFDSSGFTYLDGLLADQTFWTQEELFGAERVEVLKGPVSSLFGQAPAGGLVNIVSKRPRHGQSLRLETSLGSYDYFDAALDGNVDVGDSGAFRLNAVYRERGSFVDDVPLAKRYFAAPSFKWDFSEDTELTVLTQFIEEDTGLAQPLPAEGTSEPNPNGKVPLTRAIGEPGFDDTADISRQQVGWELSHRFNETVEFKQVARASWIDVDFQAIYPWYLDEDLRTLNRYVRKQIVKADALAADNRLVIETAGRFKQVMVAGLDYYKFGQDQGFAYDFDLAPLDIINPQYGTPVADLEVAGLDHTHLKRTGIYFQDFIDLTDRFSILLGGRYDWTDDGVKDSKFTPRAGATFRLIPDASVFVSYSASFQPQGGYPTVSGKPLDPETGKQYEAGFKAQLFDDRLTTTVALYQLTRQNIATDDPNSDEYTFVTTGEQRSRGVEIDAVIRFTPTWELVGNYAHTNAEITRDNELLVGSRTVNVPPNALSVWTKYVVPDGSRRGLGFSLGARSYDKQAGDLTYRGAEPLAFNLPSYTVVDAGVSFERGKYLLRFNVNNVMDKVYFPASFSRTFVMPGEPRTFRVGLAYDF